RRRARVEPAESSSRSSRRARGRDRGAGHEAGSESRSAADRRVARPESCKLAAPPLTKRASAEFAPFVAAGAGGARAARDRGAPGGGTRAARARVLSKFIKHPSLALH